MSNGIPEPDYAKLPAGTRFKVGAVGAALADMVLLKDADQVGVTGKTTSYSQVTRLIDTDHKYMAQMSEGEDKSFRFLDAGETDQDLNDFLKSSERKETKAVLIEWPNKRYALMNIVLGGWAHEEPDKTNAMYLTVAGKQNGLVRGFQKAPTIKTQPQDATAADGNAVGFTVEPTDDDVNVQWQEKPSGGSWTDITGEIGYTLSMTAETAKDGNQYQAVVTNLYGSASTDPATLTVS
uniref:Phage tail fiber protein n=1 Tax=Vibrio splendidus TaxID=29497 RepID=A0A0H3ZNC9_VIBSP|nr:Phage tail fiber protein [Vibrio splendidus]